jgi:putative transposase
MHNRRELDSNRHSVFLLYYHLVLVIKYRNKVINTAISNRLKEIFDYISKDNKYKITLQEWNFEPDHIHITIQSTSKNSIIKIYKCL